MLRSIGVRTALRPLRTPVFRATPLVLLRFNSTESSVVKAVAEKVHHLEDEISDKLIGFDHHPTAIPQTLLHSDQLGYLDSIGLAQGWGPTAMVEKFLEVTHVYTGLPWWASIVIATCAVRVVMFPLYAKASANAAKMIPVKPQLDKCMADMRQALSPQDQYTAMTARKKIMKDNDIHMSHLMLPVLQLPVAYGFFQALRKMANANVEGFETQGILWFTDLTQVDPYLGLQAITAGVVMLMIKLGGETGGSTMSPAMRNLMMALPVASIFITKSFSAGVVLYFFTNSMLSFIQTTLLRMPWFRRMTRLPPMATTPPKPVDGAEKPAETLSELYQGFVKRLKDSAIKLARDTNNKLEALQKKREFNAGGFVKRHNKE